MKTTFFMSKSGIINLGQRNLDRMSNFVMSNSGTILDSRYEIKREIARGGMRIVYEAYHKYTHKRVAVKVILASQINLVQLKRFQKELEAYSLLSHPNVITIYDAGIYNNYPYIVMEYIEGVDICTYVKQHDKKNILANSKNESGEQKERDWKLCAKLIYETALGLDYIHSKNMIHRDIKPANIIVRPNGSPVIIDLGLVKFNRRQSYDLTKSREIIGTIEYMALEQSQGKIGKIDARTDVYSLGLVLYELLTGQRAYHGEDIIESLYKIMYYDPPLPRKINPQIPEALEKITLHAIAKQQDKRYASMKEFANELKAYLNDTELKTTSPYAQMTQKLWTEQNQVMTPYATELSKNDPIAKESPNFTILPESEKNQSQYYDLEKQFQLGDMYYKQQDYAQSIYWYEKSANQGHIKAQFNLGVIYKNGKGVKQDYAKAVYWYEKSANQGHAKAQFNLGVMYKNGKGVKQDYAKAVYWFEKSANQGHIKAQFNLGVMHADGKGIEQDYIKAVYWYKKAANQGHAEAQFDLGLIYSDGKGVTQDYTRAFYWFEKSANQGFAVAQCNLGFMYAKGKGIEQDYAKAVYWFEKSANQGHAEAQFNLGVMYTTTQSGTQDYTKAVYWFEKSANQGHAEAQFNLGLVYYTGKGIKQDYAKAFYWFEKSANQGFVVAQCNLGLMYYNEQGVKQDFPKAYEWFEQSANQGLAEAQCNLGIMYKNGQGVQQDYTKAFYWFEKATNQKLAEAQCHLGSMYFFGQGVQQDFQKAHELWEQLANQGHARAQCNLGSMYFFGQGVQQDLQKAIYWLQQAANQGHKEAKEKLKELEQKK